MTDPLKLSAAELGHTFQIYQNDPVEVVEAFFDSIQESTLKNRIYVTLTKARAVSEAEDARKRQRQNSRLGPLDGVPVSWKDLFDVAGYETNAGSNLLMGRVSKNDCAVLKNASMNGLVTLGKTHMSELAFSGLGLNPITQTPPCVNDLNAVSGGSSSGAAASVAFGLAPAAIGSDTGGSVRIPAAWNDLVGLKTTLGRVPMQGVVPLCKSFDTVGPITKTVQDAALIFSVITGNKPVDLQCRSIVGGRLAVLKGMALDDLHKKPAIAFEQTVKTLSKFGFEISEIDIDEVESALALSSILYPSEAYAEWKEEIEASPELMYDEILQRFRAGKDVSATDYLNAKEDLEVFKKKFHDKVSSFDGVILPTCPILPPNLERLKSDKGYYVAQNLMALRNTRIGNLMGMCALTIPTNYSSCGLSIMSLPNTEEKLLRIGRVAENAILK
ncbi:MAG: amidase family protein [Paracoccaceae bacterium]|nr:amidase family protein [Paracoccaceae bacterium]